MEMWLIALLLGLSWTLILTAKIAKMLDMSYKMFLRFGVLSCVAAGTPWILVIILKVRNDPESLFWASWPILCHEVFGLISAFSKGDVVPPCVPVKRPGQGRIARTAKELASFLLMGFVLYFAARGPFPSLGQMSGWDMLGCGLFTMAAIILGYRSLFQRVEVCGNGLWHEVTIKPWEAFESYSWTGETKDGVELRLQAKSAGGGTTPLMVLFEDREVVRQILEANLPNQLSGAHDGLNRRISSQCVRVRRTRRRRFARHIVSVLCWPAVVLLLVYLWERSASLETFSGVGFVSIMITMGVNFWPSKKIEICRNGLLLGDMRGDKLRPWEEYECFFWKGETDDGVELRLPLKQWTGKRSISMDRLVVAREEGEAVQQILEANLRDRSTDSEVYSGWFQF